MLSHANVFPTLYCFLGWETPIQFQEPTHGHLYTRRLLKLPGESSILLSSITQLQNEPPDFILVMIHLSTWNNLDSLGNGVAMGNHLDQVGLWLCLWGIFLTGLTEMGRHNPKEGGTIHWLQPWTGWRREGKVSTGMETLFHCALILAVDVIWPAMKFRTPWCLHNNGR